MIDLGDRRAGVTLRFPFNTNAIAGESITIATNGTPQVYKDGGVTESTTGVSLVEDFDGLTGVHFIVVDTSADGTFYSEGSDFTVILSGATVDGKAINAWVGTFSLANRAALMPTTAARKLDVSATGEADADLVKVAASTSLATLYAAMLAAGISGVATTGTLSTTQMSASALPSTSDDQYNGRTIVWTSGALAGVASAITDYTNTGRVLTFNAVHTAPSNGDTFVIL
jgi:hypothetical protein